MQMTILLIGSQMSGYSTDRLITGTGVSGRKGGVFFLEGGGLAGEYISCFKSGSKLLPTGILSSSLHSKPAGGAFLAAVAGWPCPKAKV